MKKSMILIALSLISGVVCADVTLGPDATMSTNNWFLGVSRQVLASSYVASLSEITAGNPGDALNLNVSFEAQSGTSWVGQMVLNNSWTYTPSISGEITSLDFGGDFNSNNGVSLRVVAVQNGNTYWVTASDVISSTSFSSISYTNLTGSDFVNFMTGSGSPDFSATGGQITFGYAIRRGDAGAGARNIDIGADNVSIGLTTSDPVTARVEFGFPTSVPDDFGSVVLNDGDYVSAMNVGDGGTTVSILNGVTFYAGGKTGNNANQNNVQTQTRNGVTITVTPNQHDAQQGTGLAIGVYTNSVTYDEFFHVLGAGFLSSFGSAGYITIEMSGLMPGRTYRMQTFHLWNNGSEGSRDNVITDGIYTNQLFSMYYDSDGTTITSAVANTVVFYADATNKTFQILPDDNDRCYINGISLFVEEGTPYQTWLQGYPGVGEAAGLTDNPDNDGLDNLAEWALGGNPTDSNDEGLPVTFEPAGGYFRYVHAQRSDAAVLGLSYRIEWSDNLVSTPWTNENYEVVGTNVTGGAFDYVTNRIPINVASAQFLKLIIETN